VVEVDPLEIQVALQVEVWVEPVAVVMELCKPSRIQSELLRLVQKILAVVVEVWQL
jgi:hypothetical protein